jgi:hypothetical protein
MDSGRWAVNIRAYKWIVRLLFAQIYVAAYMRHDSIYRDSQINNTKNGNLDTSAHS